MSQLKPNQNILITRNAIRLLPPTAIQGMVLTKNSYVTYLMSGKHIDRRSRLFCSSWQQKSKNDAPRCLPAVIHLDWA